MNTRELIFTTQIHGRTEAIFDLVADMPNYRNWLPDSSAFGGTTNVLPYPVRLGTTYLDAGPVEKPGSVTEFDPPKHIAFHHTVQIRQRFFSTDVDAHIRYNFERRGMETFVRRRLVLTFALHGVFRLAQPYLIHAFVKENDRTLAALKRYVEAMNNP